MERSYTVRLTRGAYVVDEADADKVLKAVENQEPHVLVKADTFGDGLHFAPVRVITAHVISVIENLTAAEATVGDAPLPRLRVMSSRRS